MNTTVNLASENSSEQFIKPIPTVKSVFKNLLRADFKIQWRQRRAIIMSIIVPIIFIVSWKSLIPVFGATTVLSICIAIGLPGIGLMGYSQTLARDRERGVFQRLRAAPIPTWVIMTSRIIVQAVMIAFMTLVTYAFGASVDHIYLSFFSIILMLIAAMVGGLSFLALGQFVVAFVKSSEAVNSATRLIYFPLAVLGALGEINIFGNFVQQITIWSPLGTTKTILVAAMTPSTIDIHVLLALAVTLLYAFFFASIGIRGFQWSTN